MTFVRIAIFDNRKIPKSKSKHITTTTIRYCRIYMQEKRHEKKERKTEKRRNNFNRFWCD